MTYSSDRRAQFIPAGRAWLAGLSCGLQGRRGGPVTAQDTAATEPGRRTRAPDGAPAKIGKYEIRGEIGRGSCGVVYKGFDPFVQRDVAVKVAVHDAKQASSPSGTGRASFFTEARAAGMLAHPHVVSLYDAGVEASLSYIVMEYIDGETLLPLCRRGGPRAPVEQVLDIAAKCAKGLHYAHSKGVLHRDIKPSNIMLTQDGVPKIMDFSIAEINAQGGAGGGLVGSPLYMSPEQARREPLGPATDLYSLGAVLFHLLTGEPPFNGATVDELLAAIRTQPAPRPDALRAELPRQLGEIVERLLAKDPAERYASGEELAAALVRLRDKLCASDQAASRRDSRDALRRLHFFTRFADDEVDEILSASSLLTFEAGQTVVQEGDIGDAFYLIALGQAEVRKAGKRISQLDKGDCFGEIAFLTSAKRTASVVAATKVLALKINASIMDKVSRDCQLRFYKVFADILIYRLTVTSAKLSALSS
ncbi:MAG: protein kinase [Gammaproteobacteria bacterium]|nr:protein kinase [Gammaproteobacteria bacterium]